MLFVIAGPSYVGKKTAVAHFMNLYSFHSIIPYTTKPHTHRYGETEGIQYHYVDENNRKDIENIRFIYDTPFKFENYQETTLYAYKKDDIELAINSYSNFLIHASVGNVEKMHDEYYEKYRGKIFFIFMNFKSTLTKEFFRSKEPKKQWYVEESLQMNQEQAGSSFDFDRRYAHAQKEILFYQKNGNKYFDSCVSSDKTYDICVELEKEIFHKIQVMPTSPDRIPGALSDADIIYMCEKRRTNALRVEVKGKLLPIDEIKKMLCGCGMHLTLSGNIRRIRSGVMKSFIDMSMPAPQIEKHLSKLYLEKNISTGYMMKPHETILCTSEEYIFVPRDVYAIVASKFSYSQLGLSVELATSIIQSGHEGRIHFQIQNNTENYVCIYPHICVAQLLFFRTVQPTLAIYHEQDSHFYDRESSSPVSKFWDGNKALKEVKKPAANILTKFIQLVITYLWNWITGTLLTIGALVMWQETLEQFIIKYIIPFFTTFGYVEKFLLVALACAFFYLLIFVVGTLIVEAVRYTMRIVMEHMRRESAK